MAGEERRAKKASQTKGGDEKIERNGRKRKGRQDTGR